jgi:hypothetical protein
MEEETEYFESEEIIAQPRRSNRKRKPTKQAIPKRPNARVARKVKKTGSGRSKNTITAVKNAKKEFNQKEFDK